MMKLPVFTWMTLVVSFLLILALPAIAIALAELMFDRSYGTNFFDFLEGGKATSMAAFVLDIRAPGSLHFDSSRHGHRLGGNSYFSRKPLFGYGLVVFSGALIGFMGFAVWSHHMFTTGMGVVATSAFSILTMLIAIPTGVKIFNWIGTMWGEGFVLKLPCFSLLDS